jgi:hypothetical protein
MKRATVALALGLVVVLAAPAQANHIGGATYTGMHSAGGTVEFQLSADGSQIVSYRFTQLPCTAGCTRLDIGPSSGGPQITNHAFDSRTSSEDFSGTFPGPQSAQGSYRYHAGTTTTQTVTWNATTSAQPQQQPGPTPEPGPAPGSGPAPGLITTDGRDNVVGTDGDDLLCGENGNDMINGVGGDDVIFGDFCEDTPKLVVMPAGSGGNDVVLGGRGDDDLYGGNGNDRLSGEAGSDNVAGGNGNDTLNGGAGNDLLEDNAGRNTFTGGSGSDTIVSVNGRREAVTCGSGRDTVRADRADVLRGCELVRRARR